MIEQEILNLINSIMKKCATINDGSYPQSVKDEVVRLTKESMDMVNKELSKQNIDRLVYKEWKKKRIDKKD